MDIRLYNEDTDWDMINDWWRLSGEIGPTKLMMPEDSSFVVEQDKPILAVTLYLMNSKQFAWVDNLIGNPGIASHVRRESTRFMQEYLEGFARNKGYKALFCFGYKDKLNTYYKSLGYKETMSGVTTFLKEI